jgi:hypothetical protein
VLVTSQIAHPLLHIETLATAHLHVHAAQSSAQLAATSFAQPSRLAAAVADVLQRVEQQLPPIVAS